MNSRKNKIKVLVALSGGVDSSVAAALLVASKKYEVTGAFMINYDEKNPDGVNCYLHDYRDAVRVAAKLGIPILKLDFKKEYSEKVLSYMYSEYEKGRTPNPDVMCNSFIKFGSWLDKAKELEFDYLATGHYAVTKNGKLLVSRDENKDQTYFLHQLNRNQLAHSMFPIGEYTKPEVRKLAEKFDLPTADKEESMGICFIGEVPIKEFLQKRIALKPGNILFQGKVIGVHDGLSFYTIGERHLGVKTNDNQPLYVLDKNIKSNELIVGHEHDPMLYKKESEIEKVNWISGQTLKFPLKCEVRLRHRQPLQKCVVMMVDGRVIVKFGTDQRAVTPGQFAVFYLPRRSHKGAKAGKNGECLGGGVIK